MQVGLLTGVCVFDEWRSILLGWSGSCACGGGNVRRWQYTQLRTTFSSVGHQWTFGTNADLTRKNDQGMIISWFVTNTNLTRKNYQGMIIGWFVTSARLTRKNDQGMIISWFVTNTHLTRKNEWSRYDNQLTTSFVLVSAYEGADWKSSSLLLVHRHHLPIISVSVNLLIVAKLAMAQVQQRSREWPSLRRLESLLLCCQFCMLNIT